MHLSRSIAHNIFICKNSEKLSAEPGMHMKRRRREYYQSLVELDSGYRGRFIQYVATCNDMQLSKWL